MEIKDCEDGVPCLAALDTQAPDKSAEFYVGLFGWSPAADKPRSDEGF